MNAPLDNSMTTNEQACAECGYVWGHAWTCPVGTPVSGPNYAPVNEEERIAKLEHELERTTHERNACDESFHNERSLADAATHGETVALGLLGACEKERDELRAEVARLQRAPDVTRARVRPLRNSAHYMAFENRDCCHCEAYRHDASGCDIMLALAEASIGDGTVDAEIADRLRPTIESAGRCGEFTLKKHD